MGRAFTAAPLLLLLGFLALGLGAATANVSGGGRQEPIEKTLLFLDSWLSVRGISS
jgi:hypothetical protein